MSRYRIARPATIINMNEHEDVHTAMDEIMSVLSTGSVNMNAYPLSDLDVHVVRYKVPIEILDSMMDMGWVIISSWIEDEKASTAWNNTVTDVSFRIAKNTTRLVLTTDVPLATSKDVIMNLDSDDPGSTIEIISNMKQSIQKLRGVAISGYSTLSPRGLGMSTVTNMPKLSIVGLDIEVSNIERGDGMPLPHDPIISIVLSNGGWYDREFEDKCYCLYTFGVCNDISWPDNRNVSVMKVNSNEEAAREAYSIINSMSPDFVNIHNGFNFDLRVLAAASALDPIIGYTFSERRLGNTGIGIFWKLNNGTMIVDTMYSASTEPTSNWPSLGLAKMAERFDLPPKLDSGTMQIRPSNTVDITNVVEYNARDSDLHVWLCKKMIMCERLCTLAGVSRSTMWDAIANNTAVMMFCLQQSEALKRGMILDLTRNTSITDDSKYEGGFVVTPRPGCYEGVGMLDGNSLYGSIMKHLQIYVDRCVSAPTLESLRAKTSVPLPENVERVESEEVVWNADRSVIVMKTKRSYISVVQGDDTLLGSIITMLIDARTYAKEMASRYPVNSSEWIRWKTLEQCFKLLLVSVYGATGGKYSILSSRVCAEATTCAARYYIRNMIKVTNRAGYDVVYGDTDSIFSHLMAKTKDECEKESAKLKIEIDKSLIDTPFENVKADVKGTYKYMLITSRKKYSTVDWDDNVETKGMTPAKRDTLPVAKYVTRRVLGMINCADSFEVKKKNVTVFLGKVLSSLMNEKLPPDMQMIETKINCQPHYKYKKTDGNYISVLVDSGSRVTNVNKQWVMDRITGSISNILEAAEMGSVRGLIFSYNSMMRQSKLKSGTRT